MEGGRAGFRTTTWMCLDLQGGKKQITPEIRSRFSRLTPPKKLPEVLRISVDNRGRCRWETLSAIVNPNLFLTQIRINNTRGRKILKKLIG